MAADKLAAAAREMGVDLHVETQGSSGSTPIDPSVVSKAAAATGEAVNKGAYATGKQILALLQDQSRKNGMTVVIITHNSALTAMADRVIGIRNGTVAYAHLNEHVTPVEEIEW